MRRLLPPLLCCSLVSIAVAFRLPFLPKRHCALPPQVVSTPPAVEEEYEVYSRCLSPAMERAKVEAEGLEYEPRRSRRLRPRLLVRRRTRPGAVILLRCGQSEFNANQTFTGWADPKLTLLGREEMQHAGRLLLAEGYEPDVVYTSRLQRAIQSTWTVLERLDALFLPVHKTYRLNQRMYGALQGLSKQATAEMFGASAVEAWRTVEKARPPPLAREDPNHPRHDRRYADLLNGDDDDDESVLPSTESLLDCQERVRPLWEHKLRQDVASGKTVLVVAHRDALRGLIKTMQGDQAPDLQSIEMPKGIPIVFKFSETTLEPLPPIKGSWRQPHTSGMYLEEPRNRFGWQNHERWKTSSTVLPDYRRRSSSLRDSLKKMRMEHSLAPTIRKSASEERPPEVERWTDDPCEFEEYDEFAVDDTSDPVVPTILSLPNDEDGASSALDRATVHKSSTPTGPYVVLIRHGRTPHNNLGLFTGWEDPPLAEDGVQDAKNAGRLLKRHGMEFDVVYTSWLTRAIQTAYHVLEELDCVWLPVVQSWRLNERMYGALTGKSKKRVANEHGEEQLKKWRRGYTVRPPPTSSYSLSYPGNDVRRAKHFYDLPISWKETLFRSIQDGKFHIHRQFPKTESLADCMDRSIPFYTERIREQAVAKGKRVLITSHENALRGILMHLCDIPESAMNQLHLPNGLPLVYNVQGRCITLLDDGSGVDPMQVHDFGPAAQYLFKPCELGDDFYDKMLQS